MPDRHPLTPLRRWLIDAGPQRIAVVLVLALLMISTGVALLNTAADSDRSRIIEIENP
jgi:hypothetical protein